MAASYIIPTITPANPFKLNLEDTVRRTGKNFNLLNYQIKPLILIITSSTFNVKTIKAELKVDIKQMH